MATPERYHEGIVKTHTMLDFLSLSLGTPAVNAQFHTFTRNRVVPNVLLSVVDCRSFSISSATLVQASVFLDNSVDMHIVHMAVHIRSGSLGVLRSRRILHGPGKAYDNN